MHFGEPCLKTFALVAIVLSPFMPTSKANLRNAAGATSLHKRQLEEIDETISEEEAGAAGAAGSMSIPAPTCPNPIKIGSISAARTRAPLAAAPSNFNYGGIVSALTDPVFEENTGCCVEIVDPIVEVTTEYLATVDLFWAPLVGNGPISSSETTALREFVLEGGSVIMDGESGGHERDNAFSIVAGIIEPDPFGPSSNVGDGILQITDDDNMVTNGPFGDVRGSDFETSIAAATDDCNFDGCQSIVANTRVIIKPKALSATSGLVMWGGDPSGFGFFVDDYPANGILYLNAVAHQCAPTCIGGTAGQLNFQCTSTEQFHYCLNDMSVGLFDCPEGTSCQCEGLTSSGPCGSPSSQSSCNDPN